MKINQVNQNFKGISNPLSITTKIYDSDAYILSAQIDNIGTRDLDKFKEIKQRLNYHNNEINCDVLTILAADKGDNCEYIYMNGKPLLLGSDLKSLSKKNVAGAEKEAYKAEERAHIKFYTFIADLTKRMTEIKSLPVDEDKIHVAREMFAHLYEVFSHTNVAHTLVQTSILRNYPFQPNAYKINQFVQRTMQTFFK